MRLLNFFKAIYFSTFSPKAVLGAADTCIQITNDFSKKLFGRPEVNNVFGRVFEIIHERKQSTVDAIDEKRWSARHLVLLLASQVAHDFIATGHNHIYRGVLSSEGTLYREIFRMTTDTLTREGFLTEGEAQQNFEALNRVVDEMG